MIDDPYLNDFEADIKLRIEKYNQYVSLTSSKVLILHLQVAQSFWKWRRTRCCRTVLHQVWPESTRKWRHRLQRVGTRSTGTFNCKFVWHSSRVVYFMECLSSCCSLGTSITGTGTSSAALRTSTACGLWPSNRTLMAAQDWHTTASIRFRWLDLMGRR